MSCRSLIVAIGLSVAATSAMGGEWIAGNYPLTPENTVVSFTATNFLVVAVEGEFHAVSGVLRLTEPFEQSRVDARVDVGSIDTKNHERDEHLKTADFFDMAAFPVLSFTDGAVSGVPGDFKLKGRLMIRGVSKDVTFDGKKEGSDWVATTTVDRQDFKVSYGPTIKDAVELKIVVHLSKGKP